ncbi:MAG TPA: hypothetical protein VOA88_00955, partial [Candidatus Dormibacteraeota bacterium]|nr:hypothetical protein [Candidatus Dormibacteraeota bacterium]
ETRRAQPYLSLAVYTTCAASSAQQALRAQARLSTRSTRAAVQLVTDCADSPAQHPITTLSSGAQSHSVPLASGQRFFSLRLHRATRLEDRFEFTTTCAASPAQNALRA